MTMIKISNLCFEFQHIILMNYLMLNHSTFNYICYWMDIMERFSRPQGI